MTIGQSLASFAVVAALLTVIPGLDTALVLRAAVSRGRGHAVAAALGIGAGCLAWGVAAAVGASALLVASETAYRVLTLAGAVYLVGLGAHLLWTSLRRRGDALPAAAPAPGSLWASWLTGLGTNILNPKIGVFYVATIPQFIPDGTSPLLMGIALAIVHNLIGMLWFACVIGGAGFMVRALGRSRFARVADRVTGVVLVGFGLRLALQHR
ncbi:LysE family translocator [Jiangella sp. DSM 45060]|uniref:LysE family translocator n=1 Tax=Jiangella sp. DSM 45060 TaxID=1798224 RepID=UPI00087D5AF5|nr:LysE family translocator [Jiangella sp. DSM 45060]SDS76898.1 Threonine/homoserine/homoserine lactone efflux protein [Jiangella sp. DSM 45060]